MCRNPHKVVGRGGDQFGKAEMRQLADASATDGGLTDQRYHGDPHPIGVETGGVTIGGKRVEANVDLMIQLAELVQRLLADERDSPSCNARLFQDAQRATAKSSLGN